MLDDSEGFQILTAHGIVQQEDGSWLVPMRFLKWKTINEVPLVKKNYFSKEELRVALRRIPDFDGEPGKRRRSRCGEILSEHQMTAFRLWLAVGPEGPTVAMGDHAGNDQDKQDSGRLQGNEAKHGDTPMPDAVTADNSTPCGAEAADFARRGQNEDSLKQSVSDAAPIVAEATDSTGHGQSKDSLKQAVSDAALIVGEATDLAEKGQNGDSLTQAANETSPSRAEAADLTGQGPNEDSTTQAANHAAPSGVDNVDLAGQGQKENSFTQAASKDQDMDDSYRFQGNQAEDGDTRMPDAVTADNAAPSGAEATDSTGQGQSKDYLKQAVSDAALIVDEATDLARKGQNGDSLTQSANETSPSRAEAADLTGQGQNGVCEAPRNEPPSPFAFKESEVPQLDCEIKSVGSPSTSMIKVSDHGLLTQPAGEDSMSVDDSDDERVAHHDACHQTNWLTQPFDD